MSEIPVFVHKILLVSLMLSYGQILLAQRNGLPKPNQSVVSERSKIWQNVQKRAKDTVVQLFVDTAAFNWAEPYKTPKQSKSCGSGFLIDKKGTIVTNYHVIDEAAGVKIQIPSLGKEQFDVDIVGVSPERDISVLRLKQNDYSRAKLALGHIPFLDLGDSDEVIRTQEVMALGYPLGQEKLKSTQGIVSGREIVFDESYIQMTAALNPGNSGGPCLDTNGKVIGINTARILTAQGVGYIIPINDVKNVLDDLRKIKFLRKPSLGCEFNYGTKHMTTYLNNPSPGGLYVSRVFKNTLCDMAGVKSGDVIYEINGYKFDVYGETNVEWSEDKIPVAALLNRFKLGQKIDLVVYRCGQRLEFNFQFDLIDPLPIRQFYPEYESVDYEIFGGMVIMQFMVNHISKFEDLNPYLIKYNKRINQYKPKLIISHIFPTSETNDARAISEGTVISEVNGVSVGTLDELRDLVLKSDDFITIKAEDKKFMVLPLKKILMDENMLSEKYFYKRTKLVHDLGLKKIGSTDQ